MTWILPHKPNDLHLVPWNALLIRSRGECELRHRCQSFGRAMTVPVGSNQHSEGHDNVMTLPAKQGNSRAYTLDRLQRERPELFAQVEAGKLSANAAAIEAGWRKKLTAFERVQKLLPELTAEERRWLRETLQNEFDN